MQKGWISYIVCERDQFEYVEFLYHLNRYLVNWKNDYHFFASEKLAIRLPMSKEFDK